MCWYTGSGIVEKIKFSVLYITNFYATGFWKLKLSKLKKIFYDYFGMLSLVNVALFWLSHSDIYPLA